MKTFIPARWQEKLDNKIVKCNLCPRYCLLNDGQNGFCFIRKNIDGTLYSTAYGNPTGFGTDPVEKKPLFHFLPSSQILSFGTIGCNMGCQFCQNWQTTKMRQDNVYDFISPEEIVSYCQAKNIPSIAFTYNDPNIFGEFVIDVSAEARKKGIKTVMVTAGYINKEPRAEIYKNIDAANIDLKSIRKEFYKKYCLAEIEPVLDTIKWVVEETNILLELTTLLIPGLNDSDEEIKEMCTWILNELGNDIPLHFTAFHPTYKMTDLPGTSPQVLFKAYDIAVRTGLKYVYLGNINSPKHQTTFCPGCNKELIKRDWHSVILNVIDNGVCPYCKTKIKGVF